MRSLGLETPTLHGVNGASAGREREVQQRRAMLRVGGASVCMSQVALPQRKAGHCCKLKPEPSTQVKSTL